MKRRRAAPLVPAAAELWAELGTRLALYRRLWAGRLHALERHLDTMPDPEPPGPGGPNH